jgi:hypothetical protein
MCVEDLGLEILHARGHFRDLNVNGRIIIKWILGDVECDGMKWI